MLLRAEIVHARALERPTGSDFTLVLKVSLNFAVTVVFRWQ